MAPQHNDRHATTGPSEPGSETLEISAPEMLGILAGQVAGLRSLTTGLEEALSSSLCSCKPLTERAFLSFQRIDYMRQSLKDIEALLTECGPDFIWREDHLITRERLHASVDMVDSIRPFLDGADATQPEQPPDHGRGTPDLW